MRLEATKKIQAARRRLSEVNVSAKPEMTLGRRATMALDILLNSSNLSFVLKACFHLGMLYIMVG